MSKRICSIGTPSKIPEHCVSLLRFYDHGLVRIVHDLTVKKYLDASYTFNDIFIILIAVPEGHRLGVLLVPPLMHVHRFLVYLGVIFMRRY